MLIRKEARVSIGVMMLFVVNLYESKRRNVRTEANSSKIAENLSAALTVTDCQSAIPDSDQRGLREINVP